MIEVAAKMWNPPLHMAYLDVWKIIMSYGYNITCLNEKKEYSTGIIYSKDTSEEDWMHLLDLMLRIDHHYFCTDYMFFRV